MFRSSSILETNRLNSLKKNRPAPRKRTNIEAVKKIKLDRSIYHQQLLEQNRKETSGFLQNWITGSIMQFARKSTSSEMIHSQKKSHTRAIRGSQSPKRR